MSDASMFEAYPVLAAQMEHASGCIAGAAFRLVERRLTAYSDFAQEAPRSFAPAEGAALPARYFSRMVDDYGAAFAEILGAWPTPVEKAAVAPVAESPLAEVEPEPPAVEPEPASFEPKTPKARRAASAAPDEGHLGGHDGHEEDVRV